MLLLHLPLYRNIGQSIKISLTMSSPLASVIRTVIPQRINELIIGWFCSDYRNLWQNRISLMLFQSKTWRLTLSLWQKSSAIAVLTHWVTLKFSTCTILEEPSQLKSKNDYQRICSHWEPVLTVDTVLRILHFVTQWPLSSPHPGQFCSVEVGNDPAGLQHFFWWGGRGGRRRRSISLWLPLLSRALSWNMTRQRPFFLTFLSKIVAFTWK